MEALETQKQTPRPDIYDYGIGRKATGPWIDNMSEIISDVLPDNFQFIQRENPGVSYISGANIYRMEGFEEHEEISPNNIISALTFMAIQSGSLSPDASSNIVLPVKRVVVSRYPVSDQHKIGIKLGDPTGDLSRNNFVHKELTSLESAILGEEKTTKVRTEANLVIGTSSAQHPRLNLDKTKKLLAEALPEEFELLPIGPISYFTSPPTHTS